MLACICGAYLQEEWQRAAHSGPLGWLAGVASLAGFFLIFFRVPWPGETVLAVSEDAVQLRSGLLFWRREARIALDSVRSVRVRQSRLQRWLRIGSITVTAYHPPRVLTAYGIATPERVADEIRARSERTRTASGEVRDPLRSGRR
jgi:uncharacterized membrane protein YdbT with pleckstrin-like domain